MLRGVKVYTLPLAVPLIETITFEEGKGAENVFLKFKKYTFQQNEGKNLRNFEASGLANCHFDVFLSSKCKKLFTPSLLCSWIGRIFKNISLKKNYFFVFSFYVFPSSNDIRYKGPT